MKIRTYLFSALAALATALPCHALNPGDVMVVGYISDGTDSIAFVPWVELAAGETITITDAIYAGGGSGADAGSGEGVNGGTYVQANSNLVWTNTTGSPIAPGTVVVVSEGSAFPGSVTGTLRLTNNGEQIFLMQGSFNGSNNLIGDLLFGVDYEGATAWPGGANESLLPGALTSANAVDFNATDNCEYTGLRAGENLQTGYRAWVSNPSNWTALAAPLVSSALNTTAFTGTNTQPTYSPGDLMFVGWNGYDPDTLSFVSWVDIPNGESFLIFDAEYDGTGDGTGVGGGGGTYASLETMTWTNNEGVDLPAGTVIVISGMATGTSTANVGTSTGGFTITNQGEQLFIAQGGFTGTSFDGELIFGVDFESGNAWNETTKSKLPSVLNVAGGNFAVGKQAAYEYIGARSGFPIHNYAALVLNPSNWQGYSVTSTLSGVSFVETVTPPVAVPDQLGQVSEGLLFHTRRMNNKQPILDEAWSLAQGAAAEDADNLNGSSCIRIPSWIPANARAAPNAEYYLYFADHSGHYIRMAWAANLEGPWTGYRMHAGTYAEGQRGVLDLGADDLIDAGGGIIVSGHIASPDVLVDHTNQRIVMYYHGYVGANQRTVAATSADGLNFNMPTPGQAGDLAGQPGHGTIPAVYGESYFRTFEQDGHTFAISNTGDLYGPKQNQTNPLTAEYWAKGPKPFTTETESRGFLDWGGGFGALRPRHFGTLTRDNVLYAFFTNKGEIDERIQVSTFNFGAFPTEAEHEAANPGQGYNYWQNWKGDFPNQELLRAVEQWEGGLLPLNISEAGSSNIAVHELRDPTILEDADGRTYMFYSGSGEKAIGVSQIVSLPSISGSTEVTTGGDHTYGVATDLDVTPSMLRISSAVPVALEFGAEDGETQELVHAGNSLEYEQSTTVNDGLKSYRLAHDASAQSATLSFPDRYYARPGVALEFNHKMGSSTTGQFAEFQVSFDGVTWQTLWVKQGGAIDSVFNKVPVDMKGLVGRTFEMRFRYVHETLRNTSFQTGTSSGKGWFIDQISASGLEKVTDIAVTPLSGLSFTLDDITPIIDPFLTAGGDVEDRFLLEANGLHSGTGFSEVMEYGKPFVIRVRDSYEDFLDDFFTVLEQADPLVSGENADPDGDGMVNLVEHGFGSDPREPNGQAVKITQGPGAVPDPAISFSWNAGAGYAYRLEMSTTLDGDFAPIPYTEVATPNGDLLDVVLKPDPSLHPLGDKAFFRLRIPFP